MILPALETRRSHGDSQVFISVQNFFKKRFDLFFE